MTTCYQESSGRRRAVFGLGVMMLAAACGAAADGPGKTGETLTVTMQLPQDVTSITHWGAMALERAPAGIGKLETATLSYTAQIRDENGSIIGIASELEDFSGAGEFKEGAVWETYWTLVIEVRGALFLHEQEELDPVFAGVMERVMTTGEGWTGVHHIETNRGPLPSGRGLVVGGAGDFKGARGSFQEIGDFTGVSAAGGLSGAVTLRIEWEAEASQ